MTPPPSITDQVPAADVPATFTGLWTAIRRVHDSAPTPAAGSDPGTATKLSQVVELLAQAAETLSSSRPMTLDVSAELPALPVACTESPASTLGVQTDDCIDLAVQVLGNEDEPLNPVEILAITRAVTCLCAARGHAQEIRP